MTDPTYGDNPIDVEDLWYRTMRPPLVNDPEINVWRQVVTEAAQEILDSSWLVRWRVGFMLTAEGVHLDAAYADIGLVRPDGWSDDRARPVGVAVEGAIGTGRGVDVTRAIADALEQPGQTWEMTRPAPATYVVLFYAITDDEAQTYRSFLEYGRKKGIRFLMVYSNAAKADTFTLDVSLLDGPNVLAKII
jgi:hypothetical protein